MKNIRVCFFCRKPIPESENRCHLCYETVTIGKVTADETGLEFFSHREPNKSLDIDQAFATIENWKFEKDNYIAFIRTDGLCVQLKIDKYGKWDIFFPGSSDEDGYDNCTLEEVVRFFGLFASWKNWRWLFNNKKKGPLLMQGALFSKDSDN